MATLWIGNEILIIIYILGMPSGRLAYYEGKETVFFQPLYDRSEVFLGMVGRPTESLCWLGFVFICLV